MRTVGVSRGGRTKCTARYTKNAWRVDGRNMTHGPSAKGLSQIKTCTKVLEQYVFDIYLPLFGTWLRQTKHSAGFLEHSKVGLPCLTLVLMRGL